MRRISYALLVAAVCGCGSEPQVTQPIEVLANAQLRSRAQYQVVTLPSLGGTASQGNSIDNRGRVAGMSNLAGDASAHATLWSRGSAIDLGNLGGESWHTPMDINQRGDVVGFSNPIGDAGGRFIAHAFLWTKHDGMKDLGTLPGDNSSQALGINSRGQVVGVSSGPDGNRAFLWQDGRMQNLALLPPGSSDSLVIAQAVNDAGVITGSAIEKSSGNTVTFVATPITGEP